VGPLQGLEILEQLAVHPLEQGKELFPESPHPPLDRKPVELRTILLTQLDLERILGKQLVLDRQRQVPALDEFRNFFFCPQTTLEPLLSDIGRLSVA
jgi:hypothetical protein